MKSVLSSLLFSFVTFFAHADVTNEWVLVAKNGKFQPFTLEVPSGKPLIIVLKNEGTDAIEFESHSLRKERVVAPGREARIALPALQPGVYDFFDEYHQSTGLGRLIVK